MEGSREGQGGAVAVPERTTDAGVKCLAGAVGRCQSSCDLIGERDLRVARYRELDRRCRELDRRCLELDLERERRCQAVFGTFCFLPGERERCRDFGAGCRGASAPERLGAAEAAMAAANPAQLLLGELTCAVCLDYFKDPVSLDCGHHFCQACITRCWEELSADFPCPECRETFSRRNLKPNRQLRNIVEASRTLTLKSAKEPEVGTVCEKHNEDLKVFCQEDQTPICVVCHLSRDHRDHTVVPIEEAAEDYKGGGCLVHSPAGAGSVTDTIRPCSGLSSAPHALILSAANVALDPDTAHPELIVSADRRSVRWGHTRQDLPNNPERFDTELCVLGCEGFTSGRHYWEVEVEGGAGGVCAVGVARASVSRKGEISFTPEQGIWAVESREDQYWALTSPEQIIPLSPSRGPRRIRVYLDYERGQVAFFDAGRGDPIATFPPASFAGERIRPIFWVIAGVRLL
ncbi:RING finger protein 39-like [Mauremys mutica]|uniref:RING finger protein 39-like n=1 Tax=Mauremys mutica TaxID=74926 RepID=UPI001D16E04E|nr:RING finger protein 39-like [Mauremys mutica]